MKKSWKSWFAILGMIACVFLLAACLTPLAFIDNEGEAEYEEGSGYEGEITIPLAEAKFESKGNDTTGQATAWLAGFGAIPVVIDLISRRIILQVPWNPVNKTRILQFNKIMRRFLMPFHIYLSILAITLGILHIFLSSCVGNPFPEMGLILMGGLMITGLVYKFKIGPAVFRKWVYKFHASLIVSGILGVILVIGHAIMD
jgi:hypothetical protein